MSPNKSKAEEVPVIWKKKFTRLSDYLFISVSDEEESYLYASHQWWKQSVILYVFLFLRKVYFPQVSVIAFISKK